MSVHAHDPMIAGAGDEARLWHLFGGASAFVRRAQGKISLVDVSSLTDLQLPSCVLVTLLVAVGIGHTAQAKGISSGHVCACRSRAMTGRHLPVGFRTGRARLSCRSGGRPCPLHDLALRRNRRTYGTDVGTKALSYGNPKHGAGR